MKSVRNPHDYVQEMRGLKVPTKSPHMIDEILRIANELAPFAKLTAHDVVHLPYTPSSTHTETVSGRLFTVRAGAWVLMINYLGGQNDGYAVGKMVEIPFV